MGHGEDGLQGSQTEPWCPESQGLSPPAKSSPYQSYHFQHIPSHEKGYKALLVSRGEAKITQ